ncbi:MAG: hypothetical protein WAK51_04745 [Opitutaceae bacterium]
MCDIKQSRRSYNQLPNPTSPSVTPPAGAGGARSVAADHLDVRHLDSMHFRHLTFAIIIVGGMLVPGRVVALNPLVQEVRPVHAVADVSKTVTVVGGMVWYDSEPATHGIRFPPGVYVLEAEDADFLYFRSPKALELRIFKDSKMVGVRNIPGGLMLSKHLISMVPGAGYVDESGSNKMMLWKLGARFLQLKGKNWKKSF